jgi:hypothetical protein
MDNGIPEFMAHEMEEYAKIKLQEYTEFLLKEGYCDSDVVSEGNTAIDRFLNPKLK